MYSKGWQTVRFCGNLLLVFVNTTLLEYSRVHSSTYCLWLLLDGDHLDHLAKFLLSVPLRQVCRPLFYTNRNRRGEKITKSVDLSGSKGHRPRQLDPAKRSYLKQQLNWSHHLIKFFVIHCSVSICLLDRIHLLWIRMWWKSPLRPVKWEIVLGSLLGLFHHNSTHCMSKGTNGILPVAFMSIPLQILDLRIYRLSIPDPKCSKT